MNSHEMLFYALVLVSAGFFIVWVYFTWRKPEELHALADTKLDTLAVTALLERIETKFTTLVNGQDKLLQSHAALEAQMKTLSTKQKGGFDGVALAIGEAKNCLLGEIMHRRHVKPAKKGKRK